MVLASATAFGTLAIFAKLGYAAGLGTEQTLAFRFLLAALGMVALAFALGQNPLRLGRNWHGIALAMSFAGVALLLGGARFHLSWPLVVPLVLAIASPTIYTGYILIGERVMTSVPAVAASAVIMSGAAIAFCALGALNHQLAFPANARGWAVGVGIALIPTMIAISLFLAGLPRIGAARAALLSTWEPVVTVFLAVVVLGDRLSFVQVLGGVLVIVAVIVVQAAHLWRPGLPNALK